jgi:hypothetical protein
MLLSVLTYLTGEFDLDEATEPALENSGEVALDRLLSRLDGTGDIDILTASSSELQHSIVPDLVLYSVLTYLTGEFDLDEATEPALENSGEVALDRLLSRLDGTGDIERDPDVDIPLSGEFDLVFIWPEGSFSSSAIIGASDDEDEKDSSLAAFC